ncbi:Holliday junction resolvase RuvX [Williamsoniiplasma lucivorax]|uniref:Putative pre-16S rRNA nuclease n=1 Tax=Williamsoniiplasma lucivorax TaxID=209274 RepID=A0A2S5RAG2_9MOLU|nr:Holliday junction resolvase RuvX [Williamsoniiplasma lucivorax]PPE04316.1 Holliday junction DNA helicase [Williamsoniiplasma lucivorax]
MDKKILGLDVGSKTIGLATSNGRIASPYQTIRFEEYNFDEGLTKLTHEIKHYKPDIIVVGYPKNMDGSIGERAEMVDYFIEGLFAYNENLTPDQVVKIDERRTTKMAKAIMIDAGLRRDRQKKSKDGLAAQLILELYLETYNKH